MNIYNKNNRAGAVIPAESRDKMRLSQTKEYKELLTTLAHVGNKDLEGLIEEVLYEVISEAEKRAWAIGYDAGYTNGERAGKSGK